MKKKQSLNILRFAMTKLLSFLLYTINFVPHVKTKIYCLGQPAEYNVIMGLWNLLNYSCCSQKFETFIGKFAWLFYAVCLFFILASTNLFHFQKKKKKTCELEAEYSFRFFRLGLFRLSANLAFLLNECVSGREKTHFPF